MPSAARIPGRAGTLAGAGVLAILVVQMLTHLGWLSVSAHSGQTTIPWMMTQGKTLFGDLLEQHAPLSSLLAALVQFALPTAEPVLIARALNLVYVLLSTILIAVIAARMAEDRPVAGFAAALCWFWWEPIYGNVLAYFDVLLGLLFLAAIASWLALAHRRPAWGAPLAAGLLMGLATLAKQHAWAGVAVFGLWLLVGSVAPARARGRSVVTFALGTLVFPLLAIGITAAQGNLGHYLYWNWAFNLSGLMAGEAPSGDLIRKLALSSALAVAFALLCLRDSRHGVGWLIVGLWAAGFATLYPRFSLSQSMAHLGLGMVMAGVVIASLWHEACSVRRRALHTADVVLAGVTMAGAAAVLWTGAVVYVPGPLGRARIVAYDEFRPLSDALHRRAQQGDTLFILPETDSTPQIHQMSALLPPGTWIKGWSWYLQAPGVVDTLLTEWVARPPTLIVVFPDLLGVGQPGITALIDFVTAHYQTVETVAAIPLHGDAVIYLLTGEPTP